MKHIVPVVAFRTEEEALQGLSGLLAGGLPVAEITFRTPYAEEAIGLCRKRFPEIAVGAGSVADAETARRAISRGARFVVSPGLSEEIARVCAESGVPYLPGAVTPTEIMRALALGISTVKFFPADAFGGLKAVKALSAPFPQVKFVPTGGVGEADLGAYLSCPCVAAVGGSFMMRGNVAENCRRILKICAGVEDGSA